jgi:hypothetical protein
MPIPKALTFFSKAFGFIEYQPEPFGLLRIVLWTAYSLTILCMLLPKPAFDYRSKLIPMLASSTDIRWVRDDFDAFPEAEELKVAWIGGSSLQIVNGEKVSYLPAKVNVLTSDKERIATKDYFYSLNSGRTLDTYTMLQDALERKPDVVVLVVNPFWAFNSQSLFYQKALFNQGANLWWNEADWPWQFILTSPSNHLYNLVGRYIPVVSGRSFYNSLLREYGRSIFGVDLLPGALSADERSGVRRRQPFKALGFWLPRKYFVDDTEQLTQENPDKKRKAVQAAIMSLANTADNALPVIIMHRMLHKIRESGVPTLVYLAPTSPAMTGMGSLVGRANVLDTMSEFKREYSSDTLRIITHIPGYVTKTLQYRDYVHLTDAGNLPDYLGIELSAIVSSK